MILTVGKKSFPVKSLEHASARYQQFRGDKSVNFVREGIVTDDAGVVVAKVSYNGCVWAPKPWQSGDKPIMEATEVWR